MTSHHLHCCLCGLNHHYLYRVCCKHLFAVVWPSTCAFYKSIFNTRSRSTLLEYKSKMLLLYSKSSGISPPSWNESQLLDSDHQALLRYTLFHPPSLPRVDHTPHSLNYLTSAILTFSFFLKEARLIPASGPFQLLIFLCGILIAHPRWHHSLLLPSLRLFLKYHLKSEASPGQPL